MKAYITALTITMTACSVYAKEHHVSTTGLDENIGSISKPFKTIGVVLCGLLRIDEMAVIRF